MKIAIDTGPLSSGHTVRGVGFYTKNLIDALGDKVEAVDFDTADLGKYDVIHYPYFDLFCHTLPIVKPTKTVVTIHDVIPLIYPEHYPPGIRGKINFFLQKYSLNGVAAVITDTETSKKDICKFLGTSPDKVFVIYLAPGKIFKTLDTGQKALVKKKFALPDKFILYLGDVNYNKNIPNLIKARKIAKIPLVICGKQAIELESLVNTPVLSGPMDWVRYLRGGVHPEIEHFRELVKEFKNNNNIVRLGFVSDEDLVAIFNLASVYVQPSFYEGFGLPVLEAVACGTPVVAAKTQALVEIAEGAAKFVDPNDPSDIANGFKNLLTNPKLPRVYSWEKTARETMGVYKRALGFRD